MAGRNAPYPNIYPAANGLWGLTPVFRRTGLKQLLDYLESQHCLPDFCLDGNLELNIRTESGELVVAQQSFLTWVLQLESGRTEKSCQTDAPALLPLPIEPPLVSQEVSDTDITIPQLFSLQPTDKKESLLALDDLEVVVYQCFALVGVRITMEVKDEKDYKVCRVLASNRILAEATGASYKKAKFLAYFQTLGRLSATFMEEWMKRHPKATETL